MATCIRWPEKYLPGLTDNFVSNEVIVKGMTAEEVWPFLADCTKWPLYYDNASQITAPPSGPMLKEGDTFSFSTFGFPPMPCSVAEAEYPAPGVPGRLAWMAGNGGDEKTGIEVYHAWVVEDLDYGVVRILTQETQIGAPAVELAAQVPNPMLNGHQAWLDGLVKYTRAQRKG